MDITTLVLASMFESVKLGLSVVFFGMGGIVAMVVVAAILAQLDYNRIMKK